MNMIWIGLATGLTMVGQPPTEPIRAAVVDVPRVSEQYRKTADLEAHFEKLRADFNKERDAQQDRIKRLVRSLQEELKPGSEDYRQRAKQVAMLEAELAWYTEVQSRKIEARLKDSLLSIFNDIHQAVREVADGRGIELVLSADRLPGDAPGSAGQVRQQILFQKVLYWNPRLDITRAVVDRLNQRYQQQSNGQSVPGRDRTSSSVDGGTPQRAVDPPSPSPAP